MRSTIAAITVIVVALVLAAWVAGGPRGSANAVNNPLPLPKITVTVKIPLPQITKIIRLPGPTRTIKLPGLTVTKTVRVFGPTSKVTVSNASRPGRIIVTHTLLKTITAPAKPSPEPTVTKEINHTLFHSVVREVTIGLLALLVLIFGGIMGAMLMFYFGYKRSEYINKSFYKELRGLLRKD